MNIQIDPRVMKSDDMEAQVLRAIMLVVFEEYIGQITTEEFQRRFGTRGTECLSKYKRQTTA